MRNASFFSVILNRIPDVMRVDQLIGTFWYIEVLVNNIARPADLKGNCKTSRPQR